MLDIKSKGMDEVAGRMELLRSLGAQVFGVALKGGARKGGKTSADIIEHLADDNISDESRDIRPTEDDSDDAAKEYLRIVEMRLKRMKSKGWTTTKAGQTKAAAMMRLEAKRAATSASASALRKAGQNIQGVMAERAENNMTVMGHTRSGATETGATPVSPDYAAWRERRFGVPPSEVYKASGQLMADLNGPLVLTKDDDVEGAMKRLGLF